MIGQLIELLLYVAGERRIRRQIRVDVDIRHCHTYTAHAVDWQLYQMEVARMTAVTVVRCGTARQASYSSGVVLTL